MLGKPIGPAVIAVTGAFAVSSLTFAAVTSMTSSAGSDIDRTVQVAAGADAVVRSDAPTASQATSRVLSVANDKGVRKTTYLKFTVRAAALKQSSLVGAKLLLTSRTAVSSAVQVRTVASTGWNPSSLTFRNAPAAGTVVGEVSPGTSTIRWVDLSQQVTGPGVYAFALSTSSGSTGFASSEASGGPELVLRLKDDASTTPTKKPQPTKSPTAQPSPTPSPTKPGGGAQPRPGQCKEDYPGDPCAGEMYYGASVEGGNPASLESKVGARLSLHRTYMQASTPAKSFASKASSDLAAGRIPLMSTKVPGSWAGVASGQQDAWLTERIKALAQVNGPVWLALHHEPRGDGNPADWVKMQQHARTLIDRHSDNIALVGILNGWDFLMNNGNPQAFKHPVGTGVHIMGFDSYNPFAPNNGDEFRSVEKTMSPGLTIQGWGYPTLVGETGVRSAAGDGGRAAKWLRDQFAYGVAHDFAGISYFDSTNNSTDGGWRLQGDLLTAFAQNLKSSAVARP